MTLNHQTFLQRISSGSGSVKNTESVFAQIVVIPEQIKSISMPELTI